MYSDGMSLEDLQQKIMNKLTMAPPLGAKIKFDCGEEGVILLDGTGAAPMISTENVKDEAADTTMHCTADILRGIAEGSTDPTMAYMTG
ncbi:MAG: SCP2 sterol-binding domain-containing protein, partial [Alphaproteobacteria bacterium]|nr:SCP2 sterol-binding domain-containing protein [Alphaproteobacteria bacterium]